MDRLRHLPCAITAAVFAIGVVAAPAAADGHFLFVSGIPGRAIDVCINGREVVSALRYGDGVSRAVANGPTTIEIAIAAAGRCQGTMLLGTGGTVTDLVDWSYVATKKDPQRVVSWSNTGLGVQPSAPTEGGAPLVLRNASDVNGGIVWTRLYSSPIQPSTAYRTLLKGQQSRWPDLWGNSVFAHLVSRPGMSRPLFGPVYDTLKPNTRTEYYVIGTKNANALLLRFQRPVVLPAED
jgi:hypothetical protein